MKTTLEEEISPLINGATKIEKTLWTKTKWSNIIALTVGVILLGLLGYFSYRQVYSNGSVHNKIKISAHLSSEEYTSSAISDLITDLPGLNDEITFNQFSGYIGIDDNSKQMFYWFLEASDVDPDEAPLVLWTNGGPGCSGLLGLLTEHGPFWVDETLNLYQNEYSWNKIANMLYIEQPYGVGFSADSDDNYVVGDIQAAKDIDSILRNFIQKFPKYASHDVYLSGESYAGHYLPITSYTILQNNDAGVEPSLNFKGFLVGNPYTDYYENQMGMIESLYGHGLVNEITYENYRSQCWGNFDAMDTDECYALYVQTYYGAGDIDFYAVDFPECVYDEEDSSLTDQNILKKTTGYKETIMKQIVKNRLTKSLESGNLNEKSQLLINKALKMSNNLYNNNETPYFACDEYYTTSYLNQESVQTALHTETTDWSMCNSDIFTNWPDDDFDSGVESYYTKLVEDYNIKILIFSGDNDAVCGTSGTQYWINRMGWTIDENNSWQEWQIDEETAGFYTKFIDPKLSKTAIHFTTIRSAGHMVPSTQPQRAYQLFYKFFNEYE